MPKLVIDLYRFRLILWFEPDAYFRKAFTASQKLAATHFFEICQGKQPNTLFFQSLNYDLHTLRSSSQSFAYGMILIPLPLGYYTWQKNL